MSPAREPISPYGPAGVYVIDAKPYRNAEVSIGRSSRMLRPAREHLLVYGRDKTSSATAIGWHVDAVQASLVTSEELRENMVTPARCFVHAEFPLFGTLELGGVHVGNVGCTAKAVTCDCPLDIAIRDGSHGSSSGICQPRLASRSSRIIGASLSRPSGVATPRTYPVVVGALPVS